MAWVAVDKNGEEWVYCKEPCKDKEYWEAQEKRFYDYKQQLRLF